MQYHALSLLREGADVSIVGYAGEALVPSLEEQRSRVELAQFVPFEWPELKRRCWPLFALVKALALILQLTWTLMRIERPDCILVQNPPSFPVLPCVILAGLLRGVPCVIDFHNLGFSVLALALGPKLGAPGGRVVRACKWVEGWCARRATRSFVVTRAMQEYLRGAFGIHCDVLHDCPPSFFGSVTEATARHDLFSRLAEE
jgi:beta-1,4-mannosyltransferase